MTVEDFTRLDRGEAAPEGRVSACPICGRNGIEQHTEDGELYVLHTQTSEVLCDGLLTEPADCCRLPHA
ncbi:MAG: hypothetical protein JNK60_03735 [Acidobacteria bacterium]|nr:hypothetical protein [Acidobacteriota bacterium]